MFHLVNEHGNVHKLVKSERKRDELIAAGYRLVEEPVEEEMGVEDVAPYEGPQQAVGVEGEKVVDDLSANAPDGATAAEEETESPLAPDGDIPPLGKGGGDAAEEGAQDADGMNTTEDDTQAAAAVVDDTEGATAEGDTQAAKDPEPEPEVKAPKATKSTKSTAGKSSKGAAKNTKTKKNAAEE